MLIEWVYITLHVLFYGVLFSFALLALYRKLKPKKATIKLEEITLIVPFRNEINNLPNLLRDLRKQEKLPHKFLFVNDHSSDEGSALIKNQFNEFDLEVLGLPDDRSGKKEAIKYAMDHVTTAYCLTLDADVKLEKDYFMDLELLEEADMWILPVRMSGKSFFSQLASIDFTLSNILNRCFTIFKRPVLASGANLLFSVGSYKEAAVTDHFDVLSGDDMFLLRDFRANDFDVRITADSRLSVSTAAPSNFKEWIDQRVRWISKTQRVGDIVPLVFAIINFAMGYFFYLVMILLLASDGWEAIYLLLFKLFYDTLLMAPHFLADRNERALILLPLYNLLLPLYSLVLGILSMVYTPRWKDRPIRQ